MKKAMTVFLVVMGIFFIANIVQAKQRNLSGASRDVAMLAFPSGVALFVNAFPTGGFDGVACGKYDLFYSGVYVVKDKSILPRTATAINLEEGTSSKYITLRCEGNKVIVSW